MKPQITGSFVLSGSGFASKLPTFAGDSINLIGSRDRGRLTLEISYPKGKDLIIPSRDKTVSIWGDESSYSSIASVVSSIDSDMPGASYLSKLETLTNPNKDTGFILNRTKDTHSNFAIVFAEPLHVYGLFDTATNSVHLFWSTDPKRLSLILDSSPLRFLLYRFPLCSGSCLFVQAEAICSKWFRWIKTNPSVLQAFNALEHRLYGSP